MNLFKVADEIKALLDEATSEPPSTGVSPDLYNLRCEKVTEYIDYVRSGISPERLFAVLLAMHAVEVATAEYDKRALKPTDTPKEAE